MPDQNVAADEQPDNPPAEEAEAEVAAPEKEEAPEPAQEENQEQPQEEEIDINEHWKQRYAQTPPPPEESQAEAIAEELSKLPADETGNVDTKAAAQWFDEKLRQAGSQAEANAVRRAESAAMAIVGETAQQQQLLEKYPDVKKDKERLDAIFDLRDAAALRGESLTLAQAADKLNGLRQADRAEGEKSATRKTTIQAAAHLETSAVKGDARQPVDLSDKESRHAALRQFVQNEMKEGRIQHP